MCLPCEQRFHLLPPCRKNHFIFHAKIKMSIRFQAAGIGIFMTVPLMGYGILCFFLLLMACATEIP
jgi:hypothetical protein